MSSILPKNELVNFNLIFTVAEIFRTSFGRIENKTKSPFEVNWPVPSAYVTIVEVLLWRIILYHAKMPYFEASKIKSRALILLW